VLSFSDSDLAAFAAGWHLARAGDPAFPALRLANLAALEHPLSVDTYVEQTLDAAGEGARAILIRLIGGASWWRYGLAQVAALARARGIALAVLPADGRADAQLDEASTLPPATLAALAQACDAGGPQAACAALAMLARAGGLPVAEDLAADIVPLPMAGAWHPQAGAGDPLALRPDPARPLVAVVFYRAYLAAQDCAAIAALIAALEAAGLAAHGLYVTSLKEPQSRRMAEAALNHWRPAAIINATAFSARDEAGQTRSMPPVRRCSRWHWPPPRARAGPPLRAGCLRQTLPCTWSCPKSTGTSLPGWPVSSSPARRTRRWALPARSMPPMPIAWQRSSRGCRAGSRWPGALWPSGPWPWCFRPIPARPRPWPMPWASMPWPRRRRSCPIWPARAMPWRRPMIWRGDWRQKPWTGRSPPTAPP
jgi:hypothetical protein